MRAILDPDLQLQTIRENLRNSAASRLARIEVFKSVFLVFAFLAVGFAVGFYSAKSTVTLSCPPVWWSI